MYFVTTFYQMWRYRLLMREHLNLIHLGTCSFGRSQNS